MPSPSDGLPYRTAELEYGGDSFGSSLSVDLFEGNWEVRIAYDNFDWTYTDDDGVNYNVSHAAQFPVV